MRLTLPILLLVSLLAFALVAGCAGSQPRGERASDGAAQHGPVGATWRLVSFGEASAGGTRAAMDAPALTADFERESAKGAAGRLSGSGGCNRYFADYEAGGGKLALAQVGATKRACRTPVMEQEQAYFSAFESVRGWKLDGNRLTLTGGDGGSLLHFVAETAHGDVRRGETAQDTLSGEVFYRPRIALPPDAVVYVRLIDVSRADAPAVTLAEQTIQTNGCQVPFAFSLSYDASQIEPRRRYAVRAVIRDGKGTLLWTSDTMHPVLTRGAPSGGVRVEVVHVSAREDGNTTDALVGPTWQLVHIETGDGETVTPQTDTAYTITFEADGRFGGRADCNSYGGSYETEAGGTIALSKVAATLAACGPDSKAGAFMGVLNAVDRYAMEGDRLRLTQEARDGLLIFSHAPHGNASSDAGTMPPQRAGETFVYDCEDPGGDDFSFTTKTGPGELAVWLPTRFAEGNVRERYLVLGQVRSARGAKYESDGVVVWNKGNEALLEVGGETFTGCTENPQASVWEDAKRSGWDVRAVGQEPGWELLIREGQRIRFGYDYGEREVVTPAPEPITDEAPRRTTYHADTEAHDLTVTLDGEPCRDAMSGERFSATVTVTLNGETYRGCGRTFD